MIKTAIPLIVGLIIAILATPQTGTTTGFPRKPVTLIVAYSPGGAVDIVARTVAQHLEPLLGQRVVVQNKPGAGGEIGYRSLALANNDGYTIGMITSPPILMLDMLREGSATDITEFEAIASLQKDPVVVAVNQSSPHQTLEDLLAAARNSPLQINVAGDGPNSNNELQLAITEKLLQVDFNFVPYNGSGPSITALLGNQVAAAVPSASSATNYVRRGDLRVLAVFSAERYEFLPDAPTILEATGIAVPDIGAAVRGVVIPNGVPESRKQILADAIANVMRDPAFSQHAEQIRMPVHYMDAAAFREYLAVTKQQLAQYLTLLNDSPEDGAR